MLVTATTPRHLWGGKREETKMAGRKSHKLQKDIHLNAVFSVATCMLES